MIPLVIIPIPDNSLVAGAALLLTSIVGVFTYRASQRAAKNQETIGGAATAITGLEVLAEQHALEIARLSKRDETCQSENVQLRQQLAHMSGQIDTLTALTSGAARDAVRKAAVAAAEAVNLAADAAKVAVDQAADEVKHAKDSDPIPPKGGS